jgi:hypothetical protein
MTFPTVRPARPAYPPPIPSGFIDPGGKTPVERALRTQQAVADQYTAWRAAHSPNIDPDVLKANAGAFSISDAALALAPALDAVKSDAQAAADKVDELVGSHTVGDDVASRLAAQSYWHRKERVLNSVKDTPKLVAAVENLIRSATDDQVRVLSDELPDYLASRNVPAGWLPTAPASRVPGLADAQAEATLKARQLAVLQQNHAGLTNAIEKDTSVPRLLDPYQVTSEAYGE